MKWLPTKHVNPSEEGKKLAQCISNCIQAAIDENPKIAELSGEEIFEAGAQWAAQHILITEQKSPQKD